jgi:mono/diheme cytochrome c family protein
MRLRILVPAAGLAIGLAACSFAGDITPPPGYASPTPVPTLGSLRPSGHPSPARGQLVYTQHCAACHGDGGLGNGPLADRLPVAVPAIGLRDIASQAVPADWFAIVSQGRLERGMPGFASLSQDEKWDALAYVFSLSTSAEEERLGADLYAAHCVECHGADGRRDPAPGGALPAGLADPAFMSQATGIGMYRLISGDAGTDHPFAAGIAEDELWALVAYVRGLAFGLSPLAAAASATPVPAAATPAAPAPTASAAPPAEASPTPAPETLTVAGRVENASGGGLAAGLEVSLHLHDTLAGQELEAVTVPAGPDGSYWFEGVRADPDLAYWVSADYAGVTYSSAPAVYDGSEPLLETRVEVYDSTQDLSLLLIDQVHMSLDFSTQGILQVVEIYVFSNLGSRSVLVPTDGTSLPFIQPPDGASGLQFQLASSSAPLLEAVGGLAIAPSSSQYGIVAIYTLPYDQKLELSHPFLLPVTSLAIFVPEGVRVRSDLLTDSGVQDFQGQAFRLYQAGNLAAGSNFSATFSGRPGEGGGFRLDRQAGLLAGLAGLGAVLVGAGVYLYLRDRRRALQAHWQAETAEDSLGEDQDAILDAIIALDDQFKGGGLRKDAYQKRRQALKGRLKDLMGRG